MTLPQCLFRCLDTSITKYTGRRISHSKLLNATGSSVEPMTSASSRRQRGVFVELSWYNSASQHGDQFMCAEI